MKRTLTALLLSAGLALTALAQIEALTLEQMVAKTENAVIGDIIERTVFKVDHPIDGPDLYFTTITVEGRSLVDGSQIEVAVTYPGGFIDDENGVHNSEAPSEDDVQIGNEVVVFYKWLENMGGEVSGNRLWASHGGLYRTAQATSGGTVVLGRGEGYAIEQNTRLESLDSAITNIRREQGR